MTQQLHGGCLCGQLRYATKTAPLRVTICHCRFCQRATGSDRMIQPIFELDDVTFTGGTPQVYTQPSKGSGKDVTVHFCADCGTKLAVTVARWPDKIGLYLGTLHEPSAVKITPENSKHIFAAEAPPGTLLPAGVPIFQQHALENDGTPLEPVIYDAPHVT